MHRVRVVLVDDQEAFMHALVAVVDATRGFVVVGQASTGEESLELTDELKPGLVLMDVNLPGIDGIEATRRLRERGAPPVVILLSTHDEDAICFQGKLPGPPNNVYLCGPVVGFVGEPSDPAGTWSVRIKLVDNLRKVKVPLSATFTLVNVEETRK